MSSGSWTRVSAARRVEKVGQHSMLCKGIFRREFDLIAAWSVDRLGRSLQDLVALLNELHSKHSHLYLHKQGIDTTTPAGKLLFQMLGVFAEFERRMIVERVKAGLKRARAEGKVLGRPRVGAAVEAQVVTLRKQGLGMRAIARPFGIGNVPCNACDSMRDVCSSRRAVLPSRATSA